MTGRGVDAMKNLLDAAEVGLAYGAVGFVNTCWGDTGHWEGYVHALVPLIAGGWASARPSEAHLVTDPQWLTELVGRVLFDGAEHPGAEFLVRLGRLEALFQRPVGNSGAAFQALFSDRRFDDIPDGALDDVRTEIAALRELANQIPSAGWVREALQSLDLAELGIQRLEGQSGLLDAELVGRVVQHWLATSRPGGLADSLGRIKGLDAEIPEIDLSQPEADGSHYRGLLVSADPIQG